MNRSRVMIHARRWGGVLCGVLLFWPLSGVFLNSIHVFERIPGEAFFRHRDGFPIRMRSEGWADTQVGAGGLYGLASPAAIVGGRVAFWGDSYVEAAGVPDFDKLTAVFSRESESVLGQRLTGLPLANSGNSCADVHAQLPFYNRSLGPFLAHVIVLGGMTDTLPDQSSAHGARFLSAPALRFVPDERRISALRHRPWLYRLRLECAWELAQNLRKLKLDLAVGPRARAPAPRAEDADTPPAATADAAQRARATAWSFLLDALAARAQAPLYFVYLPEVPVYKRGRLETRDPEAGLAAEFAAICARRGIGFINLGDAFIDWHARTGTFPRGFANGLPWSGHLNANGHRLVAHAVINRLAHDIHAVHPD